MAVRLRVAGEWKGLGSAKAYVAGQWRTIRTIRVFRNGAWRVVRGTTAPLSATASPDLINGTGFSNQPELVSGGVTALASGGVSPYSYAWAINNLSGPTAYLSSPSTADTLVSATLRNNTASGTVTCTVTDATGATATCFAQYELTQGTQN